VLIDECFTDDLCLFVAVLDHLVDFTHVRCAKICHKTCVTDCTLHHGIDCRILAGIAEADQITDRNSTGTGR